MSFLAAPSRARRALSTAFSLSLLALLCLQTGCRSAGLNEEAALKISSFSALPAIISTGQSTVLSWSVAGAVSLTISDNNGVLAGGSITTLTADSVTVTPTATDLYTLTATDANGNILTAVTPVTVVPLPVITSFSATPSLITNGQGTTLNWTTTGTTTLMIDNGVGQVAYNSVAINPTVTTTYTLTAYNEAGATTTAQTTVTVVLAPIISSFTANPASIGIGQSSTLTYAVTGYTNLSISPGIGPVNGGVLVVTPAQTTTYILTASNTVDGFTATSTASVTVTVSTTPPPNITSFTSSKPSVGPNGVVTLTAVFTPTDGSATATIDQGVGTVTSGVPVDSNPLPSSTTFTLTVTNSTGTATAQVRVLAGDLALFAGSPTHGGFANGSGTAARFIQPDGIAVDSSGNLYVADSDNDIIREITPQGVVSTFAGSPQVAGSTDSGSGTALFRQPYGVAVDSFGNVYVADSGNETIRAITPAGVVTTLAGTAGVVGNLDGTGPLAEFGGPGSITVDGNGNLFVIDALNCNVRMITTGTAQGSTPGVVTTVAGPTGEEQVCGYNDGAGTAARFAAPLGIAVDSSDNLYVADQGNQLIRMISPQGVVSTLAGTQGVRGHADGTGLAATFYSPTGVAVDASGNVYVADSQNYTIRKITPAAVVTTIVGEAGIPNPEVTGGPLPSQLATPSQLVTDPTSGNMFITLTVDAIASAPF
jgi:sugar lactone lactonase YvrE